MQPDGGCSLGSIYTQGHFWVAFQAYRQGGSWLRALVISRVSTAARALQMALTDCTTLSALRGKSTCGRRQ